MLLTDSATNIFAREPFLTREQLAVTLQISISTVARWQLEGMPSIGRGRSVRFILSQILDWLGTAPPRGSGQPGMPRPQRRRGRPRNIDRLLPMEAHP